MNVGAIAGVLLLVFGTPLLVGSDVLTKKEKTRFSRYAALLTLKPLVATPLTLFLGLVVIKTDGSGLGIMLMAIGAGLAFVLAMRFREVFQNRETSRTSWLLLALDGARWVTSGLLPLIVKDYNFITGSPEMGNFIAVLFLAAVALPTIFAIVVGFLTGVMGIA